MNTQNSNHKDNTYMIAVGDIRNKLGLRLSVHSLELIFSFIFRPIVVFSTTGIVVGTRGETKEDQRTEIFVHGM